MTERLPHHARYGHSGFGMTVYCPGSATLREMQSRSSGPGAERGRLLHRAMDPNVVSDLSKLTAFDRKGVESAKAMQKSLLDMNIERHGGAPALTAHELLLTLSDDAGELSFGTVDYLAVWESAALVLDYKFHPTGIVDEQLGYWQCSMNAAAVLQAYPSVLEVTSYVVPAYGDGVLQHQLRRDELPALLDRIIDAMEESESELGRFVYKPSSRCAYCVPRACPATNALTHRPEAWVQEGVTMAVAQTETGLEIVDWKQTKALWVRLRDAIKRAEDMKDALRAAILSNSPPADAGFKLSARQTQKLAGKEFGYCDIPDEVRGVISLTEFLGCRELNISKLRALFVEKSPVKTEGGKIFDKVMGDANLTRSDISFVINVVEPTP